jgi:hypothetical protein
MGRQPNLFKMRFRAAPFFAESPGSKGIRVPLLLILGYCEFLYQRLSAVALLLIVGSKRLTCSMARLGDMHD